MKFLADTKSRNIALVAIVVWLCFAISPAYAGTFRSGIDFNSIMANVLLTLPAVVRLVFAISYVMGIWFIYAALQGFKEFGASKAASTSGKLAGPVVKLFAGSLLLFAPGLIDISTYSLWGYGAKSIIEYSSGADTSMGWGPVLKGSEALIRLAGYVAFIRGLVLLTKVGKKDGVIGKGITHMIGGILAINIVGTIAIIKGTLGI